MANQINQKEYLKKYLKTSKKKKGTKIKPTAPRLKIIDDDIDLSQLKQIDEADIDLFTTSEDAPQIAGIIDERPIEVQLKNKFTSQKRWKIVNNDDGFNSTLTVEDLCENKNDVDDFIPKKPTQIETENDANSDSDVSVTRIAKPVQHRKRSSSNNSDYSPPRKNSVIYHEQAQKSSKYNGLYQRNSDSDTSPPRHNRANQIQRHEERYSPSRRKGQKQNQGILQTTKEFVDNKKHERKISTNVEQYVAPIQRDRKTGQIRNFAKEAEAQKNKEAIENKRKEKYTRWGKGLKQVEDSTEKLQNDLYEMTKPLARYADDNDLEKYLKEQEREGDPMLEYMRKERKKTEGTSSLASNKLKYEGAFMPNRFQIPPGHRWDGVDRSNGYEKTWFDIQSAKKANEEEAYKWSTEDM